MRNLHLKSAGVALEQVKPMSPRSWRHIGLQSVEDATPRALVVQTAYDLKIRKAFERELRRIKFRLYLRYLALRIEQLGLEVTCLRLRLCRKLFG